MESIPDELSLESLYELGLHIRSVKSLGRANYERLRSSRELCFDSNQVVAPEGHCSVLRLNVK